VTLLPIEWRHPGDECTEVKHSGDADERLLCPGCPTNSDRADHMKQVLETCWNEDSTSDATRVIDMLADLLHFCDQHDVDIYAALIEAEDYFEAEVAPPPPDTSRIEDTAPAPRLGKPHRVVTEKRGPGDCEVCGHPYKSYGQHLRYHPGCRPQPEDQP